jgi:hypothetical protein
MNPGNQMSVAGTSALERPPSWALFGIEPLRAAFEYASMRLMDREALPRGDGHPVVIFPGLALDERSIEPMKALCNDLGYVTYDWGRGCNTGPQGDVDLWIDGLAQHVRRLVHQHEQPVSLIGWSLGGIYAREIAKKLTGRVRHVITIGTPFAGSAEQTNVSWVYRVVNGQKPVLDESLIDRLRSAPAVPTTSIYSRTDGVVAWQACVHDRDEPHTENVEVQGSHCGLGWNPEVLSIIADRLRQPSKRWQRYSVSKI